MSAADEARAEQRPQGADTTPTRDEIDFRLDFFAGQTAQNVRAYQDALDDVGDDDEKCTALLAALAVAESLSVRLTAQAEKTLAQALQSAMRANTPRADVYALLAEYAVDLSPEKLTRRRELASTAVDLLALDECADLRPALLPIATFVRLGSLFEDSDMRAVDEALSSESASTSDDVDVLDSHYAVWLRCARASMNAHIELAEQLAHDGYQLAAAAGNVEAEAVWVGQIAIIRWMQGRLSEMEPPFLKARQADPTEPIWAAALAWVWWQQGRIQAARGLIESLTNLDSFRRSRNWLAAIAILTEVAADIGSDEFVEQLHQLLIPFADRIIPLGLGISSWGTVARALALIAQRQGRIDDAIALFEQAITTASRLGAHAWLALAQVQLAAIYCDHAQPERARALAEESVMAGRNLGLRFTEQLADRLLGALGVSSESAAYPAIMPVSGSPGESGPELGSPPPSVTADANPSHQPDRTVSSNTTTRPADTSEGRKPRITVFDEFTVTSCNGQPATWKSQKARTLLKILLARRGAALARESAMELIWPGEDPGVLRNRFSVAITTIRKALDPDSQHPSNTFVVSDSLVLRLRMDQLSVDVEDFLNLARLSTSRSGTRAEESPAERRELLQRTLDTYSGQVFAGEPYAAWAEQLRRQAHLAFFSVAHALADSAGNDGNYLEQVEIYRRILASDPYDRRAHDGLINALDSLGAASYVRKAVDERNMRMLELGLADTAAQSAS